MSGLVIELQLDALKNDIKITDLLRKALFISKKLDLDITFIENWISRELYGYLKNKEIPNYREVKGQIMVRHPYLGYQTLIFDDPSFEKVYSRRKLAQSVSELEFLTTNSETQLQIPFSPDVKAMLMSKMSSACEPTLFVSQATIIGILDSVKNKILEWALELEKKGIKGEDMTFSSKEKKAAESITYNSTTYNNIGNMTSSQLQQNSPASSQVLNMNYSQEALDKFIELYEENKDQLGLAPKDQQELEVQINTLQSQSGSLQSEKKDIFSICAGSIKRILEGAAGKVIAAKLIEYLSCISITNPS
jgi:hypothetical protein